MGILFGGLCPGGLCLEISVGVSVQGVSVQGVSVGVSVRGVSLQVMSLSGRPPYDNERAVRILLECSLVASS